MELVFDNNIPIYLQIVNIIKLDIISGKLEIGERLPSVRVYAEKLKVNPNTMQKALNDLENEKLIYTERTNGKYVTTDKKLIEHLKRDYIEDIINRYFNDMKLININRLDAIKYIKEKSDKYEFS